jgi:carboxypeptidase C (cathepsin A)
VFDFKASSDYRQKELTPWLVDGVEAGQIQYGGNLTFIRVYQAGHKVSCEREKEIRGPHQGLLGSILPAQGMSSNVHQSS